MKKKEKKIEFEGFGDWLFNYEKNVLDKLHFCDHQISYISGVDYTMVKFTIAKNYMETHCS